MMSGLGRWREIYLLEVDRFLKTRNRKSRFLLPVCEMRNWESENNTFLIPYIPVPVPIPPKCAKMAKESELRFFRNWNRPTLNIDSCKTAWTSNTVETGYKVAGDKVISDIM